MVTALGNPAQLYSIYIGSNPTTEPASPATASDPGIAITGTKDLSMFTSGLSIVANQTLYLLDYFNQGSRQTISRFPAKHLCPRYSIWSFRSQSERGGSDRTNCRPTPTQAPTPVRYATPAGPLNFVDGSRTTGLA